MAKVVYHPSASQLWTPAQSPPDFWFKPVDSSLSLNGNETIALNDYLSNGKVVTAPTQSQRPTRVQNGLGSNNVIRFDGNNDILGNDTAGASGLTSVVILAVIRFISGGANADIPISIGQGGFVSRLRAMYRSNGATTLGFAGWGADVSSSTHTLEIGGADFNLFGCWNTQLATPNNIRLMKNGTVTTHTTNSNLITTLDGLSFGSTQNDAVTGSLYTNYELAEALIWYSLPSSETIDRSMGYLAWEHGLQAKLPAGFIYKDAAPTL